MDELFLLPVPGSLDDGSPVVRVVVVPRLGAAASVEETSLAGWPARLGSLLLQLQVETDDGATASAEVSPRHEADGDAWQRLLVPLPVLDAPEPALPLVPGGTETAAEADLVEETYRQVAVAPDGPTAQPQRLREQWAAEPSSFEGEPTTTPTSEQAPDVHHVVTLLRQHPAVLRRLGLVFDLPVPAGLGLGERGTLQVLWPAAPSTLVVGSPRSRYDTRTRHGLLPAATESIAHGLLTLADPARWTTATVEVEYAAGLLREAAAPSPESTGLAGVAATTTPLPPLRSTGIALLRRDLAGAVADRAARARRATANRTRGAAGASDADPLDAEDLSLGLRVDVRPAGAEDWTSAMRRSARYLVDGEPIAEVDEEEGHLAQHVLAVGADGVPVADAVVARWRGWSLGVPERALEQRARTRATGNGLPVTFDTEHQVPAGSLLPLRFGRDYEVRVRVADLAGGGVGWQARDDDAATPTVHYRRHEPVAAPAVEQPDGTEPGIGAHLGVLVVHDPTDDPGTATYPAQDARLVLPPLAALELAEQHGRLDGADDRTLALVERAWHEGGLPDPASAGVVLRPAAGWVDDAQDLPRLWPGSWPDHGPLLLQLRARRPDDPRVLAGGQAPGSVEARLRPGEQLPLLLSARLTDDYADHFAVHRYRHDAGVAAAVDEHPMVTPATGLMLVHAVRRQPEAPAGTFAVERAPDATAARLTPQPVLLGVDPAISERLEVVATWTEVDDDLRAPARAPVAELAVARDATALPAPVLQAFADTRHRRVTYELRALSRFRSFFHADEPPELFVREGRTAEVALPSTAPPPPALVHAVVPSWSWTPEEDTVAAGWRLRRWQRTGGLRVELTRPWFLTGEGEQLGVLLEHCTVGRDPIWTTGAVPRTLGVDDLPPLDLRSLVLPGTGPDGSATVTVAGHEVAFAGDRWVADVALPGLGEHSYRPFVSLGVARYQPTSLDGCHLSTLARTPLVQVLPARDLSVTTGEQEVTVVLAGLGPEGPLANRVDVVLEAAPGAAGADLTVLEGSSGAGWRVVAAVSTALGEVVSLPLPAGGAHRLRIREVEQLGPAAEATPAGTPAEIGERLVLTHTVDL